VPLKSLGLCRRFARGDLFTLRQRAGRCHLGDLQTCNSAWCVACGAKIAEVRSIEYAVAALTVIEAGGLVGFSTWTLPHEKDDALAELLKLLQAGITAVDQHRAVQRAREGVLWHFLRRLDATHGPISGFHPHRHQISFYRPGTTPQQARDLDRIEFQAYATRIQRLSGRRPLYEQGHDFQVIDTSEAAAEVVKYLCKEALRELTYTHTKWGRGQNRSIAQVLVDFHRGGLAEDRDVWIEWALAMRGKRAIRPSVGLRAELLPNAPDLTDEQVAELDDGLGLILDSFPQSVLDQLWRSNLGPVALIEAGENAIEGHDFDRDYLHRRLAKLTAPAESHGWHS
jgi:hypothetical protein